MPHCVSGSRVNSQYCAKQLKVQSIAWGWATVIVLYSQDLKAVHMQILCPKANSQYTYPGSQLIRISVLYPVTEAQNVLNRPVITYYMQLNTLT